MKLTPKTSSGWYHSKVENYKMQLFEKRQPFYPQFLSQLWLWRPASSMHFQVCQLLWPPSSFKSKTFDNLVQLQKKNHGGKFKRCKQRLKQGHLPLSTTHTLLTGKQMKYIIVLPTFSTFQKRFLVELRIKGRSFAFTYLDKNNKQLRTLVVTVLLWHQLIRTAEAFKGKKLSRLHQTT